MDPTTYIPDQSDTSLGMLHQIYGKVIEQIAPAGAALGAASPESSTLEVMFGWFNSGVLFLGALVLLFVTAGGIAHTAHDGEVLGRRWHTFWTPLRMLVGSAGLIPSSLGYSAVQILMAKIIVWSVGFASIGWTAYINQALVEDVTAQAVKSVVEDSAFDELASNAIKMQVCAYATNKALAETMGAGAPQLQPAFQDSEIGTKIGDTVEYTSLVYYNAQGWPAAKDLCGQLSITMRYLASTSNSAATQAVAGNAGALSDAVNTARYGAMLSLFGSDVRPIAAQITKAAEGGAPVDSAAIRSSITALRQKMVATLQGVVRSKVEADNAALVKKFAAKGWMWAGALHMEVGKIKDAVRNASRIRNEFQAGAPAKAFLLGDVGEAVDMVQTKYNAVAAEAMKTALAKPENMKKPMLPAIQSSFVLDDFADQGTGLRNRVSRWFKSLGDNAVQLVVYSLDTTGTKDMLWQVKDLGDNLAVYGESALVAKAGLVAGLEGLLEGTKTAAGQSVLGNNVSGIAAFAVGAIAGLKMLVLQLAGFADQGIYLMIYAGYFLGIWIPMIPYYVYTVGVAGWLILVAEALIASSLWTLMHLTPDTEGSFIGSQRQGYMLVASIFLRPSLMLFGLILSFIIITPITMFVNETFMTQFRSLQADSTTGILSVAGYILVYCTIIGGLFMMVFGLCQTLPDRILNWIGGGVGDLGEQNTLSRVENNASGQARAATVAVSGVGRAGAGAGKDAVRRANTNEKDQAREEAHGRGNEPEGHTRMSIGIPTGKEE